MVIYSIYSMIILNIETSTDACSAAITAGGKVLETGGEALATCIRRKVNMLES